MPELVDEMYEYVAQNWHRSAVHLAAYLLWRVNWIHPFSDGNGRTARAVSYLVLCVRLLQRLPGDRTMPDFIADDKTPYYAGLEAADAANARGKIDVSVLERYLRKLLGRQVEQAASAVMLPATPLPTPTQIKRKGDTIAQALAVDEDRRHARRVPYITGGAGIIAALIAALVIIGRCGKESRCVLGLQQACPCAHSGTGTQICIDDGLRFSPCECIGAATAPPDAALLDAAMPAVDAPTPKDAGAARD